MSPIKINNLLHNMMIYQLLGSILVGQAKLWCPTKIEPTFRSNSSVIGKHLRLIAFSSRFGAMLPECATKRLESASRASLTWLLSDILLLYIILHHIEEDCGSLVVGENVAPAKN